jgi:hypothetical protein
MKLLKAVFEKCSKNPEKYQLLCANCNWKKRIQNKEHIPSHYIHD